MTDRFGPDYRLELDGKPISSALRASITSISHVNALEGADRVEIGISNHHLRWTDDPSLGPGVPVRLSLGYNPAQFEQMFVGEIVSVQASFPSDGQPTLTVAAHDRFERLREAVKTRWYAVPLPFLGNKPVPDPAIAALTSVESGFIPIIDPVGAAISVLIYGASILAAAGDQGEIEKVIRLQDGESDLEFLQMIASENGWEMLVDHSGDLGGHKLRFMSPLDRLEPVRTFAYGSSLLDWSPRLTTVGVIASITGFLRVPAIKTVFEVTVGYDWDNASLDIAIRPAIGGRLPAPPDDRERRRPGGDEERKLVLHENLSLVSAPRRIISELLPKLNNRITGSGSVVGDTGLKAGDVVQLEGLGKEFGGRYRITSASHTIDSGGYRTSFEGRKEIWFGSIPAMDQGAVEVSVPFAEVGGSI
jgi:hypothetical protein